MPKNRSKETDVHVQPAPCPHRDGSCGGPARHLRRGKRLGGRPHRPGPDQPDRREPPRALRRLDGGGRHRGLPPRPGWKHKTEVWDEVGGRWENGRYTLTFKNQAADKCLQPADAKPARGTTIVVRSCDGSDLQRWVLRPEGDNNSRWWIWQPKVDTGLAMTLNRYNDGSWNSLYLDTSYPSADRLWHLADDNTSW
nr:RICIN domain-containing protein [Streptomyces albidoflavus]